MPIFCESEAIGLFASCQEVKHSVITAEQGAIYSPGSDNVVRSRDCLSEIVIVVWADWVGNMEQCAGIGRAPGKEIHDFN